MLTKNGTMLKNKYQDLKWENKILHQTVRFTTEIEKWRKKLERAIFPSLFPHIKNYFLY